MSAAMRATADAHAKLTYLNTITVYCYLLLPSAKTVEGDEVTVTVAGECKSKSKGSDSGDDSANGSGRSDD